MRTFEKSSKLDHVLYDVRGPVVDEAARMEEAGMKILKLNIGNPAPFGFTAPEEVIFDMRDNIVNYFFHLGLQGFVRVLGKDIRRTLHPLGDIAVPKVVYFFRIEFERRNASRIVKTVIDGVYRDFPIHLFFRRKIAVCKLNLSVIK